MSDFQNTIDLLGDDVVAASIVDRSIKTFDDNVIKNIGERVFCGCQALTSVNFPSAISIDGYAFYYCSNLASVNIPLVTSIGYSAFYYCRYLTSINLPLVTSIKSSAFNGCSKLTSLNLPSLTSIDSYAFQDCAELISINLPSLTNINYSSFINCSKLASIRLPAVPPTSTGSNPFDGVPTTCVIYIPTGSLAAYQADTKWSSLISKYTFTEEDR